MTTEKSASDDAVLNDVFATDRDRGGKSAPPDDKAPEPKPEPKAEAPAPAADKAPLSEAPAPEEVDESQLHPVPRGILKSEREKFRTKLEAESKARIEAETTARLYEQQLRSYATQTQQTQQRQPQRPVPPPDPALEPEQFAQFFQDAVSTAQLTERLNSSEDRARDKHGDATVDEAFAAAEAAGLIQQQHFIQANPRHPYGALMDWHKRQKVLTTVGDDPDAYRKKIEDEVRAQVLDELKAGKGQTQTAGTVTRFPGSLAEVTASGQQGAHLTDEAVMAGVFSSNRRRK